MSNPQQINGKISGFLLLISYLEPSCIFVYLHRMIFFITLFSQVVKEVEVPMPGYSNGACKIFRWPIFKLFPVRSFSIFSSFSSVSTAYGAQNYTLQILFGTCSNLLEQLAGHPTFLLSDTVVIRLCGHLTLLSSDFVVIGHCCHPTLWSSDFLVV